MGVSLLERAGATRVGWLGQVDPRSRIVAAAVFSVVAAAAARPAALLMALACSLAMVAASGMGWRVALGRLLPLNAFLLLVAAVVSLGVPGQPLAAWGSWAISREGLCVALAVVLKANAIVLSLAGLVGALDLPTVGHALHHLRVPDKLVHLMLFTVRYLAVLEMEYRRLAAAMKVRGFRPGMNRHTWRTYGYLVGMLLVRSLDRAERVAAAMKCRGFRGRFHLLDHFALTRADAAFALFLLAAVAGIAGLEWR